MGVELCDVCADEGAEACAAERFAGFYIECWFSLKSGLVAGAVNSRGKTIGSDMPSVTTGTDDTADANSFGGTTRSCEGRVVDGSWFDMVTS